MFYLYHSNDLELLKELLAHKLQENPAGPFEQEAILVQSQGMSHWLKMQLAESLGVAAQIEFPLPSKFIWRVFNALKPELPKRTHFDKQIMAWKLMALLPTLAEQEVCAPIAHYLQHPDANIALLKRYQLAQNIADTFDQYLIYRPDWLLHWESGQNTIVHKNQTQDLGVHAWQPVVWRELIKHTPVQLPDGTLPQEHRGRVHLQLKQLMQTNGTALATQLPKRLFVFGIATLPKVYWQVLKAISSHVDVHFYLLNPCNEFAGDIVNNRTALKLLRNKSYAQTHADVGNPLLASWGKLGREFLQFVQQEEGVSELELFYWDDKRTHLLAQLQQDIFKLHNGSEQAFTPEALEHSKFKRTVAPTDGSVRIVSAHSPLRELQRLYDQILFWLEQDSTLKSRDIVVMVPDINQYAPYIDAVFASHKAEGDYRIRYAIADQAIAKENPIIDSFLALLNLPNSRFLSSEMLDLLGVPAIAQRFELNNDDLNHLQEWLVQAEIRWGIDGKQRADLGLPKFEQNSWRQGLKQLLLGAMLPNAALASGGYQGDLPVFAVEGNETERLGKLMAFIDQLDEFRQRIQSAHLTLADWQILINDLLAAFYAPEDKEVYAIQSIRAALDAWQEDTALAGFEQALSGTVVSAWFNDHLGQQTGWQRFLAGPVNFCSLMPMRSIPFKAVCMLGMNDSDYPRRVTPMGFDLIQRFPAAGDRARREDDRYLFLEALSSAQDYLYLSYRGHDVRANSEQQPSVLVAELRDYLGESFCLEGDEHQPHKDSSKAFLAWLEEELPLQPYNKKSFFPSHPRGIPSYQKLWADVAQVDTDAQPQISNWPEQPLAEIPADLEREEVLLANLKLALENPPKFFMTRRLQTYLTNDWASLSTTEPFELDGLEKYWLKNSWLQHLQADPSSTLDLANFSKNFSLQQQQLGHLPVGAIGQEKTQQLAEPLKQLAEVLLPILQQKPLENRAIDYSVQDTWLRGELNNAYLDSSTGQYFLLFHRVGRVGGKYLLGAWLELLLASLYQQESITSARYYGIDKNEVQCITLIAPEPEQAVALLQQALTWYWRCWQEPIAHLPDALYRVLNAFADLTDENAKVEAIEALFGERGLTIDAYTQRCLAGFIDELPMNYATWLDDFGGLMSSLIQHIHVEKEEA